MGRQRNPITLNKYLYANADPVNGIDPSGRFTLVQVSVGLAAVGIIGATQYSSQIGGSFAGGVGSDEGYTSRQTGWLILAAMSGAGSKLYDLVRTKLDERDDSTVDLYRAVEDVELASLYACNCFSLGSSGFPKQFFLRAGDARQFGEYMLTLDGALNVDRYHLVSATISSSMRSSLRDDYEPGLGPFVEVPNGLLPAFNMDMDRYGGWSYISTH